MLGPRGQGGKSPQPVACRYDGIVVGHGLVIGIARLSDRFPAAALQDRHQEVPVDRQCGDSAQVFPDFFGHGRRQDAGICPGIGGQLLLIELLGHGQGLVGTDLEKAGAVILELGQVVEERRIFLLLFALDGFDDGRGPGPGCLFHKAGRQRIRCGRIYSRLPGRISLRSPYGGTCTCTRFKNIPVRHSGQIEDQPLRVRPVQETGVLVEAGGPVTDALLVPLPLGRKGSIVPLSGDFRLDPEKGGLDKGPDLPLPPDDHAQDTGHDTADRDDGVVRAQGPAHGTAVAQSQGPGEVDPHQVVLAGAQVGRGPEIVVGGGGLCLPDPAQDLLLGLGVDPDPELLFALHTSLGGDEAVDVLALPPGVGADIDGVHLRVRQDPLDDGKLFFDAVDHLILIFFRDEGNGRHGPLLERGVIGVRIGHGDQVADTPGDDRILSLHISVGVSKVFSQSRGKGTRHARFFSNIYCLRRAALLSLWIFSCAEQAPVPGITSLHS